jgi:hypothetical protein
MEIRGSRCRQLSVAAAGARPQPEAEGEREPDPRLPALRAAKVRRES